MHMYVYISVDIYLQGFSLAYHIASDPQCAWKIETQNYINASQEET